MNSRRHQHDEQKRADIDRRHPQTLAAGAPVRLAALGGGSRRRHRLARLHFKQHHQGGQRENGHEEKHVVAHDRADQRHLLLGGGKHAIFRKFVQAGDDQLRRHKQQNDRGDAEEFLQVDADAALDKHHAEGHRDADTQQRAQKTHQLARIQVTAERIRTVSTPSRMIIRNTNRNRPMREPFAGQHCRVCLQSRPSACGRCAS